MCSSCGWWGLGGGQALFSDRGREKKNRGQNEGRDKAQNLVTWMQKAKHKTKQKQTKHIFQISGFKVLLIFQWSKNCYLNLSCILSERMRERRCLWKKEIGSNVVQAGFKFIMQPRMALNFWPSSLRLKSKIPGMCPHACFYVVLGIEPKANGDLPHPSFLKIENYIKNTYSKVKLTVGQQHFLPVDTVHPARSSARHRKQTAQKLKEVPEANKKH